VYTRTKLHRRLQKTRLAALAAIELGDCRAVARLTCEAARIRSALSLTRGLLSGVC